MRRGRTGGVMKKQWWKWSVETEELADKHYVRVIEDGVVSIKGFGSEADAKAFANSERARFGLELDTPQDNEPGRQRPASSRVAPSHKAS
ncbi:hypothetical protein CK218_29820 [Mesorhizobium sp. WSM3879]|nr:hypothetical protein CK218_29820 [Mesorhizobium sp. WSM3879]